MSWHADKFNAALFAAMTAKEKQDYCRVNQKRSKEGKPIKDRQTASLLHRRNKVALPDPNHPAIKQLLED